MLLRPENPITPLISTLTVHGDTISAKLPERDERFRAVLRRLDYTWSGTAWERTIDPRYHGTVTERAAELAHALLGARFLIELPDLIAQPAIAGDYAPECRRWVKKRLGGSYLGWFALSWGRTDDLYAAARRLHGSRYDIRHVVVPPDSYREVQDFADAHGFQFSDGAREAIADAHARYTAAVLAVPAPRRPASPRTVVVEVGGIDPDLRDENDVDDNDTAL